MNLFFFHQVQLASAVISFYLQEGIVITKKRIDISFEEESCEKYVKRFFKGIIPFLNFYNLIIFMSFCLLEL
jgi:flagellar biosynthesis protein FlhB